jgi:hypothetical protein
VARASIVEYGQVAQACYELFQRGEPVSFQRVYDIIGNKGSNRVVTDFMKQWRKEAGDKLAVTITHSLPGLPESLVGTVDDLLVKIWSGALESAEQSYQKAMDEVTSERAGLRVEREKEQVERQILLADNARLTSELKATQDNLGERGQSLQMAQAHGIELETQLRNRDVQVSSLREDVARLLATYEAGQRQHADELANAQAHAATELVEVRQSAKQAETQLRADLTAMTALRENDRQQSHQASLDASQWRGRAEGAEATIERLADRKA